MKWLCVCILLAAANIKAQVQDAATPFSGMADLNTASFSPWCVFSNQAGIARSDAFYAGISYRHRPGMSRTDTKGGFVLLPSPWGNFAASYTYFGYQKYNEQSVGLVYARQLTSFWDIGIKVNYLFAGVAGQAQSKQAFFPEVGCIFSFSEPVLIGIRTSNPGNLAQLTTGKEWLVEELYAVGVSWEVDRAFWIAAQVEDRNGEYSGTIGAEYRCFRFLKIKTGVKTGKAPLYAGAELKWKTAELGFYYQTETHWGNRWGITLGVGW